MILSGTILYSFAQTENSLKISIGPEIGMPVGQANKLYNLTEGFSVKMETPLSSTDLNLTITAGYSNFRVYNYYSQFINNGTYVPIEVGLKKYLDATSIVYFLANVGASFNINGNSTGPKTAPIFSPGIGISIPAAGNGIDLSGRYEGRVEKGGTVSQLALCVAYRFGYKKE